MRPFDTTCTACASLNVGVKAWRLMRTCDSCRMWRLCLQLFANDKGAIPGPLRPFVDVVCAQATSSRIARIRYLPKPQLAYLRAIARREIEPSIEQIAELGSTAGTRLLRTALLDAGIVTRPGLDTSRLEAWINKVLPVLSSRNAAILRQYYRMHFLPRLRHRYERGSRCSERHDHLRYSLVSARRFLEFLEQREFDLASCPQAACDAYLAQFPFVRVNAVARFLRWARGAGRTRLSADFHRPDPAQRHMVSDRLMMEMISAVKNPGYPMELRAAAALIVLYGMPLHQIITLRTRSIGARSGDLWLHLDPGRNVLLAPPLRTIFQALTRRALSESGSFRRTPERADASEAPARKRAPESQDSRRP